MAKMWCWGTIKFNFSTHLNLHIKLRKKLLNYVICCETVFSNKTIEKSRDGRYCGKKIRNVQADVQIICRTIRRLGLMLIAFYEFLFGQN